MFGKMLELDYIELDKNLRRWSEMIECNAHGDMLEETARFFEYEKYEHIFHHVNEIHKIEGYLPVWLAYYRSETVNKMYDAITKDYDEAISKLVRSC